MEDRIRKFMAVADAKSFSKAAQQLHISQPALTTAIQKLERELKTTLIERGPRSISLTPAGEIVLQAGRQQQLHLLRMYHQLRQASARKPMLRIGLIDSLAETLFLARDTLQATSEQFDVSLVIDSSKRLQELLDREQLDIAFTVQSDEYLPALQVHAAIGGEPMIAVAAPGYAARAQRLVAEGERILLLSYNSGSQTDRIIRNALELEGVTTEIVLHSTSPHILLGLALKNRGLAVLPYVSVVSHLQSGALQAVYLHGSAIVQRPLVALVRQDMRPHAQLELIVHEAARTLTMQERAARTWRNETNPIEKPRG